ncbi:hypothetical protein [Amycolatopsis sp.]|uniref:hypothetical protein n=1 Tax=Amycolatopsis sp. TaxID=37632 RepID=UPI002C8949D1|nr:hypothetical protein [Amycolatopsis sp.]HVV09505.1 hypothetical protein [Amycolatopsis sp.]
MATVQHASYNDWQRVYGDVYEALPAPPAHTCPNCGHRDTLRLEFVASESDRIGYGMFWCGFCLFGIRISRTWVPEGVSFHPFGTPQEELRRLVPEYTVVYPPADEDPEGFEEVVF